MKIGIIGGTSGLGEFLARFLSSEGCDVVVTGRDLARGASVSEELGVGFCSDNLLVAGSVDVVIVCVPIDSVCDVIREVCPVMVDGSLLMDVASVKEEPCQVMLDCVRDGVEFIPSHPVFGPRVNSFDGQVVVLTPVVRGEWYGRVVGFLESVNASVVLTSAREHDEMMGVVQILTHFSYISAAVTISRLGITIEDSRRFSSPVYNMMVDMISRIVSQNPYLTYSIQTHNRSGAYVRELFLETVEELMGIIGRGDVDGYVSLLSGVVDHLGDIGPSLARSDKAISSLGVEYRRLCDSVGLSVGLEEISSGDVFLGRLLSVDGDCLSLLCDGEVRVLEFVGFRLLDSVELRACVGGVVSGLESFCLRVALPEGCDVGVMCGVLGDLDGVFNLRASCLGLVDGVGVGWLGFEFVFDGFSFDCSSVLEHVLVSFGAVLL